MTINSICVTKDSSKKERVLEEQKGTVNGLPFWLSYNTVKLKLTLPFNMWHIF